VIFLTAESVRSLLPTIQSRVLHIPIQTPDQTALFQYFIDQGKAETAMTQAFFLSGGLPGLMSALLDDEQEHPLLTHVSAAKELLQKSTFERLAMVDGLAKQKASLNNLLEALLHIALSGQQQAAVKQDAARIKQWHRIRKEVQSAQEALAGSANSKLVLTKMLLHM
jgi:hypothetical protein